MTKRVKLTKPQRELLDLIAKGEEDIVPTYKPAMKLKQLGFAEIQPYSYGVYGLQITPAGRAYLAEDRADD